MLFLQFGDITHAHIIGIWQKKSAAISSRTEGFACESLTEISFMKDYNCKIISDRTIIGKWRFEYHKEILPNPIVYFDLTGNEKSDRAMITRFSYMPDKYGEDKNDEMILYFSNGCEIVLEKISE